MLPYHIPALDDVASTEGEADVARVEDLAVGQLARVLNLYIVARLQAHRAPVRTDAAQRPLNYACTDDDEQEAMDPRFPQPHVWLSKRLEARLVPPHREVAYACSASSHHANDADARRAYHSGCARTLLDGLNLEAAGQNLGAALKSCALSLPDDEDKSGNHADGRDSCRTTQVNIEQPKLSGCTASLWHALSFTSRDDGLACHRHAK